MAKIHVDDLLVLNRKDSSQDGSPYIIRSYTGQDFKDSVQEVIDDNQLDDRYVLMSGDTMNGQLIIDLGIDALSEEDVESLTVLGSTKQTQVVISPIVAASELPHASLVFTSTDPFGNRLRDHNIATDTNLQFRKFYADQEDSIDMFLMTDEFCYTGLTLRVGNEISTAEAQISADGTAIFNNVIITQTDPLQMRDDNLIHKIYVDSQLSDVEDRLTELVTVDKDETYSYRNGNQPLSTDIKEHEFESINTVGGVLRVTLQSDTVPNDGSYEEGGVYSTTSEGGGTGLKVITAVVDDDVVGVAVAESGYGYNLGETVTLTGGLEVTIQNIAVGTTSDVPENVSPVESAHVKWQLFPGATDETWGEIDSFYFSSTDLAGDNVDVDVAFPVGQVIDVSVQGMSEGTDEDGSIIELEDQYYARYRIVESRVGPSFAVTSTSFAIDEEKGLAYSPLNDVVTESINGSGEGLTLDITEVDPDTGFIVSYSIRNPGVGYVAGERVAIDGGVSTAILTIDSIETEVPQDKENLLYVGVEYQGFSLEDENEVPPLPSSNTEYLFTIKRTIASQPPVNGIFTWDFTSGLPERFENINKLLFSVDDSTGLPLTQVNFPVGSVVDLINPSVDISYGRYEVTKSTIKTIGVPDPIIEGAINEFDYIELEVILDLSDTAVLPKDVNSGFYDINVTISIPILTEMELEKERVDARFDGVDTSLTSIKEEIDALENSVSSGGLVYGAPLLSMGTPGAGRMYFYTADNNATSKYNDPNNEVVGVMLSPFDFISTSQKEWDAAIQPNESVLYIDDFGADTTASYIITSITPVQEEDEVVAYNFGLQKITTPPGDEAELSSAIDNVNRVKTRLLNDGISREEALDTFAALSGSTIQGTDTYSINEQPRIILDPLNYTFTLGYISTSQSPVMKVYGETGLEVKVNDKKLVNLDDSLIEISAPIELSDNGNDLKITGIDTDENDDSSATNVGYVQGYVQEYVDGIVGLVRPASSTNLGPIKLDSNGVSTLNDSNQLTIQNAGVGNGWDKVGVAAFNSSHFYKTSMEAGYSRIGAKTLTNDNHTDRWGMVKIDAATIKVNSNDKLYVRSATSSSTGVMKVQNNTNKDSVPNWNSDTYNSQAGSARAVSRAHQKAKEAWDSRMYGGKALHTTGTPEVGGIKKSGSTYYLRIS